MWFQRVGVGQRVIRAEVKGECVFCRYQVVYNGLEQKVLDNNAKSSLEFPATSQIFEETRQNNREGA